MNFYHPVLLFLLLCLTLAWLYLYWYRGKNIGLEEGFQQERNFVSKVGNDIYDSFYAEIYDEIAVSDADYLINAIIQVTQPTLRYSSFLDVGCGTGNIVQKLNDNGYIVTGIDHSHDMIESCQQKLLNDHDDDVGVTSENKLRIIEGDVLNSMQFDRAQFSHIICAGLTLYEWEEAEVLRFFRNCYFWTIAGGYLFLHLVDPHNFLPTPNFSENLSHRRRIINSEIQFPDFSYTSNYSFDSSSDNGSGVNGDSDNNSQCSCTHRETFVDLKTQHVRENEIMLYFLPIEKIVSMALRSGFVVKAQWNLLDSPYSDSHQFIYMFERTL